VRTDEARAFGKIIDGFDEFWRRRIGADVEMKILLSSRRRPKIFAIVGEAHVMRLAASADGDRMDHFP